MVITRKVIGTVEAQSLDELLEDANEPVLEASQGTRILELLSSDAQNRREVESLVERFLEVFARASRRRQQVTAEIVHNPLARRAWINAMARDAEQFRNVLEEMQKWSKARRIDAQ